jgi:hypothetical protein
LEIFASICFSKALFEVSLAKSTKKLILIYGNAIKETKKMMNHIANSTGLCFWECIHGVGVSYCANLVVHSLVFRKVWARRCQRKSSIFGMDSLGAIALQSSCAKVVPTITSFHQAKNMYGSFGPYPKHRRLQFGKLVGLQGLKCVHNWCVLIKVDWFKVLSFV